MRKARTAGTGEKGMVAPMPLLCKMHERAENLVCTKHMMRNALTLVHGDALAEEKATDTKGWATRMNKKEIEHWTETLQRRIRNMCRITQQGQSKSPRAQWVIDLPWKQGAALKRSRTLHSSCPATPGK